jgi:hypothetical protein
MFFEDMDITYLGPVDGHNVKDMVKAIGYAKRVNKAVLIHVCTKKGIGYGPAEKNPSKFHGTPPFDIATGQPKKPSKKPSYTDTFSSVMLRLAAEEPGLVGITAAARHRCFTRQRNLSADTRTGLIGQSLTVGNAVLPVLCVGGLCLCRTLSVLCGGLCLTAAGFLPCVLFFFCAVGMGGIRSLSSSSPSTPASSSGPR